MQVLEKPTRYSLIERLRLGAEPAWAEFFALYAPVIENWLQYHGVPKSDADDLTQRIIVRVFRGIKSYDQLKGRFRTWLRTVVNNAVVDAIRLTSHRPKFASGTQLEYLATAGVTDGLFESVSRADPELAAKKEALARVESRIHATTWQAYCLSMGEGQSAEEVATALGLTAGYVRTLKSRITKWIRDEMAEIQAEAKSIPGAASD